MALPFFYADALMPGTSEFVLPEEASRHIIQVLRMHTGESVHLTDGKGHLFEAEITDDHKKKCTMKINSCTLVPARNKKCVMAVSLLKNASRFEWFLEKATELGISAIIPLLCKRTEKQHFRRERMNQILISAMIQSQQTYLPELYEPQPFSSAIRLFSTQADCKKYFAHCDDDAEKKTLSGFAPFEQAVLFIGPEGDFTTDEIQASKESGFLPVHLGETRLRTETAAITGAVLLSLL